MTFLETLRSHRGGLVRLKEVIYWYDAKCWDNNPGRVCLILDVNADPTTANLCPASPAGSSINLDAEIDAFIDDNWNDLSSNNDDNNAIAALLMVDGSPKWIWVVKQSVELITSEPS